MSLIYLINKKSNKPRTNPNNAKDIIPPQGKFISYTPKVSIAIQRGELLRVNTVANTGEIQFDKKDKSHLAAKVAYDELHKADAYVTAKQNFISKTKDLAIVETELNDLAEKHELLKNSAHTAVDDIKKFEEEFLAEEDEAFLSLVELLQLIDPEAEAKAEADKNTRAVPNKETTKKSTAKK